jgi:hypothetical protein
MYDFGESYARIWASVALCITFVLGFLVGWIVPGIFS